MNEEGFNQANALVSTAGGLKEAQAVTSPPQHCICLSLSGACGGRGTHSISGRCFQWVLSNEDNFQMRRN